MKNQWITDEDRWQAIVDRNAEADAYFVYGVKTSGMYCLPSSTKRLPKKENVVFFESSAQAEKNGYRASQKIQNRLSNANDPKLVEKIEKACRYIELHDENLSLSDVADHVGMSAYHFHRVFKHITGLTPKGYADAHKSKKLRENLNENISVTDAIFNAGFNSNSQFYENSNLLLGMTAKEWKSGGKGVRIFFAIGECSLGDILVAQSQKGICAILLGDDPEKLLNDLQDKFPEADLIGCDDEFEQLIAHIVGFIEAPQIGLDLPLDIQGTAFQQRVWQALKEIPAGQTASYSEIAQKIGSPKAVRAVAGACAANMLAVAIPCHRVIRNDGFISGYRWGVERKRALLDKEAELVRN
ncbi:bifunctional DNA-binding transcriptional regulator/O6-methylguanine-DNA methyltransferase Ada [Acinetobacter lactucae]|uniref:bifunctional DNA-binding transcriptional regulator/O6-methylguanine-DNA methyltransferase Ada n=1 Tax=Acinetobacter lactucae TaxID=1785128 RepID=UPI0015804B61|nr:bifunctional DNA-binding transcriptional regulator/O6-methylguanine-DNA methyltransferase Ada [Acinetobacter lactucae]NUF38432.1 bifunctional DNA-binding transcriptional regulator/O6-methylguanine-DNA methyltransferase Ada [Acinetobacter lactucae]